MNSRSEARAAALLLGIGLGGFLDGIVLHQILQWHNMISSVLPPVAMPAMRRNMWWDGWFHLGMWLVSAAGVFLLWRLARAGARVPRGRWFIGFLLLGWGAFNIVEGVVDHQILGIHHVRGYRPDPVWDMGFLLLAGVGLALLGLLLARGAATGEETP